MLLAASSCSALLRRGAQRASPLAAAAAATAAGTRSLQTQALPDLPYDFNALEPVIPAEIMQLHHSKHHQAYVSNLNAAAEKHAAAEARGDVAAMVSLQPALRFNGGGHVNHSLLWQTLCPVADFEPPRGALERAIEESFGGGGGGGRGGQGSGGSGSAKQPAALDRLQQEMAAAAVGVQGSGWAWLGFDPSAAAAGRKGQQQLVVRATANQDPLGTAFPGLVPLYGIDVWEHAYYLRYKNARPDYVREIWKVTDWRRVAALFEEAAAKGK